MRTRSGRIPRLAALAVRGSDFRWRDRFFIQERGKTMAGESTNTTEALVLSDESGNLYAIPRETLDSYRLTDAQKAAVKQDLQDDEVAGFLMFGSSQASSAAADYAASSSAMSSSSMSSSAFADSASADSASSSASSSMLTGSFFQVDSTVFNPAS